MTSDQREKKPLPCGTAQDISHLRLRYPLGTWNTRVFRRFGRIRELPLLSASRLQGQDPPSLGWTYYDSLGPASDEPDFEETRLILKLKCLGIDSKVLDIIKDFLMGRTFRVSVQGEFSSFKNILSGIPQGSVLGPLLFILFINDLPDCLKSTVKIFADDLKLIANLSDKNVIEDDLKTLENWERKWLLEFNTDKCKVLHIEFNDNKHLDYVLNDKILKKI